MFGIGGGELILIVIIALMLFGTKGLPEAARTFAKVMSQLRNATNDIKSEITKEVTESGIGNSVKQITSNFDDEVNQIKNNVAQNATQITEDLDPKVNFDDLEGPIKRQF